MAEAISVPAGFKIDFAFVCDRASISEREEYALRNLIRADFAVHGGWVQDTAKLYRFCDETWGAGVLPAPEHCQGLLAHYGWYPEDETIFRRLGILQLVKLCMDAAEQAKPPSSSDELAEK